MTFTPHGKSLIAGNWQNGSGHFSATPVSGPAHQFSQGTAAMVEDACSAAEEAFWSFGAASRANRASFLVTIAEEIEARGDQITQIGCAETGLPEARLQGERGRTTGQLRAFAQHIETGDYLDRRHDPALPERAPLPRPDLKLVQRPIGPVAVFGASNFPLAFSTAGGDTASAFAAGCPVVVKAHPAHPGTGEIVAEAIKAAVERCGLAPGVFSFIQDAGFEVGTALVQHPLIRAVGFTGSLRGGRALYDLCAARAEPIPFFGELGSINPMFLLPGALVERGAEIARGWAASLTMGAGQFCTNPGVAIALEGAEAKGFAETAVAALGEVGAQVMLTEGIAQAYETGCARVKGTQSVETLYAPESGSRQAAPALFATSGADWMAQPDLAHEVFGPLGILVMVKDEDEMRQVARALDGQLTATLHLSDEDMVLAGSLMPILERKAGRILANGFPTGVEVADAMVHGGPYPASTNFGATSVGTMAIRRFLRPVCYQAMPDGLLPGDLLG